MARDCVTLSLLVVCFLTGCHSEPKPKEGESMDSLVGSTAEAVIAKLGTPLNTTVLSLAPLEPALHSAQEIEEYNRRLVAKVLCYDDVIVRINIKGVVTHVTERKEIPRLVGKTIAEVMTTLGEPVYFRSRMGGKEPVYMECWLDFDSQGIVRAARAVWPRTTGSLPKQG